jgi:hypothetical protein
MAKAKPKAESKSVVSSDYAKNYHKSNVKTASGVRFAVDCNDAVAKSLRGLSMDELKKVAKENGLIDRFNAKWANLNSGLCRMALGNALRHLKTKKRAA